MDTQTLLHYQWLDQIDWLSLLGTDRVEIILAPVVINEMDKHKRDPQKRRRDRARDRISQISDVLERGGALREGATLRAEHRESPGDLLALGLDREINDDRLIGSVVAFISKNPHMRVALTADDLGLKLKARHHNIEILSLPTEYSLVDEPDPLQIKAQKLEQELRSYKSRLPELRVAFQDWGQHVQIELPSPAALTQEDIAARVGEAGTTVCPPYRPPEPPSLHDLRLISLAVIGETPPPDEVNRYHTERESFLEAMGDYWTKWPDVENRRRLTVELQLFAVNDGTAPAEDILLILHVPDGVEVVGKEPAELKKPAPPAWPRANTQMMHDMFRANLSGLTRLGANIPDFDLPGNVSGPTIRRTNSFTIDYSIGKLIQKRREPLDSLYLIFDGFDTAHSLAIDYQISSASLPDIVEGQVHVVVEKAGAITA
ncbi:MAG: PIN domain-containing protein [Candidatus Rokuibacteriota bacterium]